MESSPQPNAPPALRSLQLGEGWFPERPGGLNRVVYHLARHLPEAGVGVRGLVVGSEDVAAATGGRVAAFAAPEAPLPVRMMQARQAVRRVMADERLDVVAAHFALYAAPAVDVLGAVPLVVHFHGPWAEESRVEGSGGLAVAAKARIERRVYRRAARCIVLSEAFRAVLHRAYGVPEAHIRVVPGGVDVERFDVTQSRAEAREALGWPADRPLVLAVRRLRKRMGLEDLISAMTTVRRAVPEALLLIAGRGPLETDLKAHIEATNLDGHVRLLGFIADDVLPLAYRAADLSVVPTTSLEGFGLVTLEALAAGTPVLVTPVGGLPEAVRGLSENLILPEAGPAALADGLSRALRGTLALPDAPACRRYARETFAWPIIARRVRAVYEEALDGARAG